MVMFLILLFDYDATDADDIKDIYKYLMKETDVV